MKRAERRYAQNPPAWRAAGFWIIKTLECYRKNGGARRNRTDDLFNAIEALSQLSYGPTFLHIFSEGPGWEGVSELAAVGRDRRRGGCIAATFRLDKPV